MLPPVAELEQTEPVRRAGRPVRGLRAEVVEGPDRGLHAEAKSDSLTIGTAPGNDVVVTDPTVSRYHLELRRDASGIVVEDLQSTNGTGLPAGNQMAFVSRGSVPSGTVLVLGRTKIRVDDGAMVEVETLDEDRFGAIVGRSPGMRALMARIQRAAVTDTSVLVLGETGCGKELIARALHEGSARAGRPFETVDCGALLSTLVSSELFGHEKGAFTGADNRFIGAFERAEGGTLFLDEIGELPKETQTALLGALERRAIRRVGGSGAVPVDVRVIAATHRDLRAEVNSGNFRQDLYYRLAVVMVRVPPLRERPEDIPLLVEHFTAESGQTERAAHILTAELVAGLKTHHWPGNVRELRNFVEAALALGELPRLDEGAGNRVSSFAMDPASVVRSTYHEARSALLRDFERVYLEALIAHTKGNVSSAARLSDLSRTHLIGMLKRHGIEPRRGN